jgi:hypothetical protein
MAIVFMTSLRFLVFVLFFFFDINAGLLLKLFKTKGVVLEGLHGSLLLLHDGK